MHVQEPRKTQGSIGTARFLRRRAGLGPRERIAGRPRILKMLHQRRGEFGLLVRTHGTVTIGIAAFLGNECQLLAVALGEGREVRTPVLAHVNIQVTRHAVEERVPRVQLVAILLTEGQRREKNLHRRDIEPAFRRLDISEVCDPFAVGSRCFEAAVEHVRRDAGRQPTATGRRERSLIKAS